MPELTDLPADGFGTAFFSALKSHLNMSGVENSAETLEAMLSPSAPSCHADEEIFQRADDRDVIE